ncbi:MAG: HAMP domain-containing histidine kinase, partial [Holophagales bacterium]|nr:HAMP domain-containing histidine kinase [Holophagales bacterium]
AAVVAHRESAPLRRLASAASEVGEGSLGIQVPATSGDVEIRHTLTAFNRMSERLAELDAEHRRLQSRRHLSEIADIARGLAHSLRNPLNALGLSVEELAAPRPDRIGDEGRQEQLADAARRQIRRLDHGIRSFLLLASPSDGDGLEVVRLDVAELVRDVALEALQERSDGTRVEIQIGSRPAELDGPGQAAAPPAFHLDGVAPELRAVIQALVVNALEASPEGTTVRVVLETVDDPGLGPESETAHVPRSHHQVNGSWPEAPQQRRLRLEVLDRGPGLDSAVRERLFTPHLSTKPSGSGMGLFLAHRIATYCYTGSLELLDREGGGTRARLLLGPRVGALEHPGALGENAAGGTEA